MVAVHVQIAVGAHGQIEQAVAGKGGQHMIKKADARLNVRFPRPVQVERQLHVRLRRPAGHRPDARSGCLRQRHPFLSVRMRTARACAGNPSTSASRAASLPSAAKAALEYTMTPERRTKSSTLSWEAKRAVPLVGSTWLLPAT